jgi:glycosyltransferase involved in cell wall biosynthesis
MRLAILTSTLYKMGGAQIFARNIADQLARHGHAVDVYTPDAADAPPGADAPYRVRGLPPRFFPFAGRIPVAGRALATAYLSMLQLSRRYDGWLAIMSYPSGYALAGLRGRVPIALRCSGEDIQKAPELDYGLRLNSAAEERIRRTLLAFDRLVALTPSVTEDFAALGIGQERVVVIPNGVDLDRLHPSPTRDGLRDALGWPQDRLVVLTIGRNHVKKGYDLIPGIARRLADRGIAFHWYVVGLYTTQLQPALEAQGVADMVTCVEEIGVSPNGDGGAVPPAEIVRMYQAADVFAFPSLLETFGMVQIEAMAAGLAVVSTDAPGCRDVVEPGVNGLRAVAGDEVSFTQELQKLLEDSTLRTDLAVRGRRFAEGYGWESVARQYEAMFTGLAEAR